MKTLEELNDLRARVLAGEVFPADEYREILKSYRALRGGAVAAAAPKAVAKAKSAAAAAPVDLGNLFSQLGLPGPKT